MIYVAFYPAAFLASARLHFFLHEYQEIGDDVTLCTFYPFFSPLPAWACSRAMLSGWRGM